MPNYSNKGVFVCIIRSKSGQGTSRDSILNKHKLFGIFKQYRVFFVKLSKYAKAKLALVDIYSKYHLILAH